MLGHFRRRWWVYLAGVLLVAAWWFDRQSTQARQQWDRLVEESEVNRVEFAKQVRDKVADLRKAPGQLDGKFDTAREIITLQTEQYQLLRESMSRTRELSDARHDADFHCYLLTAGGLLVIEFGLLRAALRWRRKYLALRATTCRVIEADEATSGPRE